MSGISAVSPPISAQPASSQPLGDAADDGDGGVDVELAGGEVVEEEQRLGALHEHVVDAHRDQVDADRVVAVELLGELELGADAVGARDQHRLAVLARQVEQRAEAAQAAHHFGPETALDQRLDAFDDFVARVDVDAGVAVGERSGGGHAGGHGARGKRQGPAILAGVADAAGVGAAGAACGTMQADRRRQGWIDAPGISHGARRS